MSRPFMVCFLGVFCSPYDPVPVLGSPSEGLGADLLTHRWQIRLFWTAVMMRVQARGNGGEDVKRERERGESEEWREGEHRRAVPQIFGGQVSHNIGPLLCPPCLFPPPPPLLCHSGLDYFILIRLIPPRGKLLITSPPPTPPDESNLLSAWGQDEGLLRLIGEKNVKGETEKRPWQQLWSGSMRRFGPPWFDKLAGGTPFVVLHPPTSL